MRSPAAAKDFFVNGSSASVLDAELNEGRATERGPLCSSSSGESTLRPIASVIDTVAPALSNIIKVGVQGCFG